MTEREDSPSPVSWFGPILAVVAVTNISVLLNIPVLRQVSGFIFLTFVPGFLFLSILKLNRLGLTEKLVLSVGLSAAFSMLFGWAFNGSSLALGYTNPLSTTPLLISFSIASIVMAVIAYVRNRGITFFNFTLKLTGREKLFLIIPSVFPLLSIFGMYTMELTTSNVFLMLLLFLIPAYIVFVSFYHRQVSERIYPITIFLISISLLLMLALRSSHILGSDSHDLYYLFQTALREGHWRIVGYGTLDACLSASILPTVYQSFLNINPEYLFKLITPLLFSVSPLVIYITARKYIGSLYALLGSFLFMAQVSFLWSTGLNTTNIAILFFALVVMVMFHQDIGELNKRILFIIFAISAIVSHYGTAYVFLFILLLTWLGMRIIPRVLAQKRKTGPPPESTATIEDTSSGPPGGSAIPDSGTDSSPSSAFSTPHSRLQRGITITIVALFFVMLFFWYSQVTQGAFSAGVTFVERTFANLHQWFLLESRGATVTTAMGGEIASIPQKIRVLVSWLSVVFIAVGVLSIVVRYKRMVATRRPGDSKPGFLRSRFEMEYIVFALACSLILVITVVFPYVSQGYSMERTYFQALAVLSPFFVIGSIMLARWLRERAYVIALLVLVPFFMCTTGTMYQVFGEPASIILNSEGRENELWYVHNQDSHAARWLGEHNKGSVIYTGAWPGPRVLESQGNIHRNLTRLALKAHENGEEIGGCIYLRYADVTLNNIVEDYPDIFIGKNRIYTTNGAAVYR